MAGIPGVIDIRPATSGARAEQRPDDNAAQRQEFSDDHHLIIVDTLDPDLDALGNVNLDLRGLFLLVVAAANKQECRQTERHNSTPTLFLSRCAS